MRRVELHPAAFDDASIERMRAALARSPLVGPSVLKGGFEATRGFAVVFRREGVARLCKLVPAVAPFLEAACELPTTNAFYLNLLVVPRGASVAPHEDGTLTTFCGLARGAPVRVTVLYLDVPSTGGALRLHRRIAPDTVVTPVIGTVLHFRGDLTHSVDEVIDGERMSLVLEQYALDARALAEVPECHVASEGHFARVLAEARAMSSERDR